LFDGEAFGPLFFYPNKGFYEVSITLFFCGQYLKACIISRKVKGMEQATNPTIGIVHISENNRRLFN
jgi:hypothetical protein